MKIRQALGYLRRHLPSRHPLADQKFEIDGLDLFIQQYGQLINVSQAGQLATRSLLEAHLQRIERDQQGIAIRLHPCWWAITIEDTHVESSIRIDEL